MKNEAFGRVNKNHTIWKILSTKSAQKNLLEDKKKKKKNSPVTFNIFYNTSVWSLDLF